MAGKRDVVLDALANALEDLAEVEHPAELRLVANATIHGMVAVLLPAAGIARGDLEVPALRRADPDIGPRRRNDERREALELRLVEHRLAVGSEEHERLAATLPANAGHRVSDVSKARGRRGFDVFFERNLSHVGDLLSGRSERSVMRHRRQTRSGRVARAAGWCCVTDQRGRAGEQPVAYSVRTPANRRRSETLPY